MEHYSSFKEEQELISSVDPEKSYGAFFKHVPAQSSHRPRFVIFEDVTGEDNAYTLMIHIAFVRNGKSVITQKLVNGPDAAEEFVKIMH